MSEVSIKVQDLSVSYGKKRVLSNIFLNIESGNIYGVIGPNGAGKSTLFKSILGLIDYNAGDIDVFGTEVDQVRKRIAYVPQKDEVDWQFPATVLDIVMMGRFPHKTLLQKLSKDDYRIADEALDLLDIQDLKDRQIGELSGGQQQRVFLARAICQEADIYLLDEPFVGVDVMTEEKIIEILRKLANENKTMLVVHHDLSTVEQYFNKVLLLNQRLVTYGDTKTVFSPENIAKTYGAQLNILHRTGGLAN